MENTDKNQNKKDGEKQGFNWKNKNLWMGVVAILIVALIIVVVAKRKSNKVEDIDMSGDTAGEEVLQQPEVAKPVGRRAKAKAPAITSIPATNLTYDQAVAKYRDSRIQFDANCTAVPANVTFKNGAEFMLDNRAPVDQKFSLNGEFTLPAYGFKIMKINSDTLPRQFLIDCGYKQNVATILLQK